MELRRIIAGIVFVALGCLTFAIGYNWAVIPQMTRENRYSVRLYTGYLGMFVGVSLAIVGVYLFLHKLKSSASPNKEVTPNPIQVYSVRLNSDGRRQYRIFLDSGTIILWIGFSLWILVAVGILGQSSDIFSNPFFDIGGVLVCTGGILMGIGGIAALFKR